MAANVTSPLYLPIQGNYDAIIGETVTKGNTSCQAFLGYTRAGVLPATDGAYCAGICTKDTPADVPALPLAQSGYAIVRVKPGAAIAVDGPVAIAATGEAIAATGTNFVIGRALDSSTGTGTAQLPHYIVIALRG